jgi:hypothetical protein
MRMVLEGDSTSCLEDSLQSTGHELRVCKPPDAGASLLQASEWQTRLNGDPSSMRILLVLPMVALAGCLASRMQSIQSQGTDSSSSRFDPAQRLSPTAFEQNATMKDTSVHEDPSLLKVGVSRDKITAAFGAPNQITNQGGREQEVYEFNPDGSKFVKPKTYARNIAAGVFTGGIATVVHQARIHHTEQQLTVYHLTYGPNGTVQSVQKESRLDTSHNGDAQD